MDNKYFPENSKHAIKTLERVSREWENNVVKIQWKVLQPNSRLFAKTMRLFYLFILLLFALLALQDFRPSTFFFIAILASPIVYLYFFHTQYYVQHYIVHRKKRKAWEYASQSSTKIKYGDDFVLPAFRLPENDTGVYAQMRKKLQQAISAETGWRFRDDDFNIIE